MKPENLFQALSDETRLRCLALLAAHDELCVCELTFALGVVQPKISRHLAILREQGVVADRRQGLWVYYRINPGLPEWAREVVLHFAHGASGQMPYAEDSAALGAMPNRPGTRCCA